MGLSGKRLLPKSSEGSYHFEQTRLTRPSGGNVVSSSQQRQGRNRGRERRGTGQWKSIMGLMTLSAGQGRK